MSIFYALMVMMYIPNINSLIAKRHVVTKSETSLVESKNSLIRHYLARFNRKTKRYSKAIDMIENSLLLLFNRNLIESIFI